MYFASVTAFVCLTLMFFMFLSDLEVILETKNLREVNSVPDGSCDLSDYYLKTLLNLDIMMLYVKTAVSISFYSTFPALLAIPFSILTAEFFGNILIFITIIIASCGSAYGFLWNCYAMEYNHHETSLAIRTMINESWCENLPKKYVDNLLDHFPIMIDFYRTLGIFVVFSLTAITLVILLSFDCWEDLKNFNLFSHDNAPMFPVLSYPWKRSMLMFFDKVRVFCGFERKHTVAVPASDEDYENAKSAKKIILKKDISTDPYANVFENCENL